MKIVSIGGSIIGFLSLIVAFVNQFHFVPIARRLMDSEYHRLWAKAHHRVILAGELVILVGAVGLILSVIPLFGKKDKKIAFAGIIVSLVAIVMGLAQGTHMFAR